VPSPLGMRLVHFLDHPLPSVKMAAAAAAAGQNPCNYLDINADGLVTSSDPTANETGEPMRPATRIRRQSGSFRTKQIRAYTYCICE